MTGRPWITTLTLKHEELLRDIRDEWLAAQVSTDPADRPAAEEGIRAAYEAAGLVAPGFNTIRLPSCGKNSLIGSSRPMRPSSTSIMIAQLTRSLVLEKARKIWSTRSGMLASRSARPTHC